MSPGRLDRTPIGGHFSVVLSEACGGPRKSRSARIGAT